MHGTTIGTAIEIVLIIIGVTVLRPNLLFNHMVPEPILLKLRFQSLGLLCLAFVAVTPIRIWVSPFAAAPFTVLPAVYFTLRTIKPFKRSKIRRSTIEEMKLHPDQRFVDTYEPWPKATYIYLKGELGFEKNEAVTICKGFGELERLTPWKEPIEASLFYVGRSQVNGRIGVKYSTGGMLPGGEGFEAKEVEAKVLEVTVSKSLYRLTSKDESELRYF